MKKSWCWVVFAGCCVLWAVLALTFAPVISGPDVYIFRDAGWNLATTGSFVSAGLPYMTDLAPRFYSHYTPLVPLLFGGFLKVFPKNAYAGTVFNLLLGIAAAATVLILVRRQPPSWYRTAATLVIAAVPVFFVTADRPEALGLVLFVIIIAVASRQKPSPVLEGLLVALTFLAYPFAALCAAIWIAALAFSRSSAEPARLGQALLRIGIVGVSAVLPLLAVAFVYYRIDPTSLHRFAQHALVGSHTGLGVVVNAGSATGYLGKLHKGVFQLHFLTAWICAVSVAAGVMLAVWLLARHRALSRTEKLTAAAGLACMMVSVLVFPNQWNYIAVSGILVPAGLLTANRKTSPAGTIAIAMLFVFFCAHLPSLACAEVLAFEQRASFHAAEAQPEYLRERLGAGTKVVAVSAGGYDLFKPSFDRLVSLEYMAGIEQKAELSGIANCYFAFSGSGDAIRSLPPWIDTASFQLVQRAPEHLWITLFGHRLMRRQWGYGCDLYVRKALAADNEVHGS